MIAINISEVFYFIVNFIFFYFGFEMSAFRFHLQGLHHSHSVNSTPLSLWKSCYELLILHPQYGTIYSSVVGPHFSIFIVYFKPTFSSVICNRVIVLHILC